MSLYLERVKLRAVGRSSVDPIIVGLVLCYADSGLEGSSALVVLGGTAGWPDVAEHDWKEYQPVQHSHDHDGHIHAEVENLDGAMCSFKILVNIKFSSN